MKLSSHNILVHPHREDRECQAILWNPLTGAMDLLDRHLATTLERGNLQLLQQDTATVEQLLKRGYVYADEDAEKARLAELYKVFNWVYARKPMNFIIIPTYRCTFNCTYCFESQDLRSNTKLMTEDIVDKAFDAMTVLSNEKLWAQRKALGLFGGEPLIATDQQMKVIEGILERAREDQFNHIKVVTNGGHLEQYIDMLLSFEVDTIQLTLDGPKDIHDRRRGFKNGKGSFENVLNGIRLSLEKDFTTHLRINLDAQNLPFLPDLVELLVMEGFTKYKNLRVAPAVVGDFGKIGSYKHVLSLSAVLEQVFSVMMRHNVSSTLLNLEAWPGLKHIQYAIRTRRPYLPKFKYCDSEVHTYAFDVYGNIYTCPDIIGRKEFAVGTFSPELQLDREKLAQWRTKSIFNIPVCQDCEYALVCGGGCGLEALNKTGSLYSPDCPRDELKQILELTFGFYYDELIMGSNSEETELIR